MEYTSTRDNSVSVESAVAIAQGISDDGGLFVPKSIPRLTKEDMDELIGLDYVGRAVKILGMYLTDFTKDELYECARGAYIGSFDDDRPAPLYRLCDGEYILELWHGPTCAFKDLALQILPWLLTKASQKTDGGRTKVVLVATSGDTGKAALEGFADVKGTKILVFYPENGVSDMQKLQMVTQSGDNVAVCAIEGNFDDAQTGVKRIFTDSEIKAKLEEASMSFSSANSINWGRLVPQIVYYVSAYLDLLKLGTIKPGDKIDIAVPTGNFGNILAAYYAYKMGIPVARLVCASNSNNVLTDFIRTGTYDRNREFFTTTSPSMDILISSNLERLIYHLGDENSELIRKYMEQLAKSGQYTVNDKIKGELDSLFWASFCDDKATARTIASTCDGKGYLCDTHTAVALNVFEQYKNAEHSDRVAVVASTASPFKFSSSVLGAIAPAKVAGDEFEKVKLLESLTGVKAPKSLVELKGKKVRFDNVASKDEMKTVVFDMLGL